MQQATNPAGIDSSSWDLTDSLSPSSSEHLCIKLVILSELGIEADLFIRIAATVAVPELAYHGRLRRLNRIQIFVLTGEDAAPAAAIPSASGNK